MRIGKSCWKKGASARVGEVQEKTERTEALRSMPGLLFQTMTSRMYGYRVICLSTRSSPFFRFQCSNTAVTPTTLVLAVRSAFS